jgi:hypothetical protein
MYPLMLLIMLPVILLTRIQEYCRPDEDNAALRSRCCALALIRQASMRRRSGSTRAHEEPARETGQPFYLN